MKSVIGISLLAAIASVLARDIPDIQERDGNWWKHANVYEVWLKSFQDSNRDGKGDIKGLISRLDYLKSLGVDTIYLPPFYPSGEADGGFDITNYKNVDPVYGSMDDFTELVKEMKKRDLFLLIDLVINHTSVEHEWFKSSEERVEPYTDYYVWANPSGYDYLGNPKPPNNWFELMEYEKPGSGWTWSEKRKQYYYHQFMVEQPDLNLRNPQVKEEVEKIMTFWLDRGVSGFRVDAPMVFMEHKELHDNPELPQNIKEHTIYIYDYLKSTANLDETFEYINELNRFLRKYDEDTKREIQTPMIGEAWGEVDIAMKYFGTKESPAIDLPFNFLLPKLEGYKNAKELDEYLHTWLDKLPEGKPSNWALGNHDGKGRLVQHFNPEYNYILQTLVSMLPGTATVYYGEELGMSVNRAFKSNEGRDRNRTPMQWDTTENAGFATAGVKPWAPVDPSYWSVNVKSQSEQENSSLNYFKDLMWLRRTDTGKYGDLISHFFPSQWVLAYSRTHEKTSLIVFMNLGSNYERVELMSEIKNNMGVSVVGIGASIVNACSPNSDSKYKKRSEIIETTLYLRPHSVLILGTEYMYDEEVERLKNYIPNITE